MKKILLCCCIILHVLLQGCDKFLDLKPENIKVVSTIEDYRDILASYMKYLKTPNGSQIPVLGSYSCNPVFDLANYFAYRTGELTPSKRMPTYYDVTIGEYTTTGVKRLTWMETADNLWRQYYSFLGPINLVINGIESAEGSDERLRDYVKGEALVWRVYSYFKLLQWFSPYKNNEYGIPIYLQPYEDVGNVMPERKTQAEVYEQLLSDSREILELMERTPSTNWNSAYEPAFVHGMLASIYWYKALSAAAEDSDWENALKHAEEAMRGREFVRDSVMYAAMFDANAQEQFTSSEFNLRLIDGSNAWIANFLGKYYQPFTVGYQAEAEPEADFYASFKWDDVRKLTYFRTRMDGRIAFDKYNLSANFMADYGMAKGAIVMFFRTANSQLIKAEALFRLGRDGEAKEALDFFKKGRYLDVAGSYTESDLLDEILKERKLEFYHEQDMWWLDMKRLGTRMERVVNGTLYVLEPDDWRYCFPIPQSEMEVNRNMVQNPGWDEVNL